jgi:hypothetical protein
MKRSGLFGLALVSVAIVAVQNANAGSAVATDGYGHLSTAYGGPMQREKQRVLETARRRGWADARIIAASDVTGYGAIAVARKGNGSVIGAALGRPSRAEAEHLAIEVCLKGGGTDPKVRWEWHG